MKKLFKYALLILTAAGLASCQKVELSGDTEVKDYSIIVSTDDSKTVNDGMSTNWVDGDKMTMLFKRVGSDNVHSVEFTYDAAAEVFKGNPSHYYDDADHSYNWWGVYPYSSSITSNDEVAVQIPANQTQKGNDSKAHLAGNDFPLWGRTSEAVLGNGTPYIYAHQVATVLDFVITNSMDDAITVNKIEFTAPNAIAGACKSDLTASNVKWVARSSNVSNTVTLTVNDGVAIEKGASASFYAGAIPFAGNGQYTITVYASGAGKYYVSTKTVNANLECVSGTINKINHSFNGTEVKAKTYTKVTTAPSDWTGTYLIVKESANIAFAYNQDNYKTSVSISNGTITSNDLEAYEVTVSTSSLGAGKYDVKVGGKYLYKYGSSTDPAFFDSNISGGNQYFAEFIGDSDVNINFHRSGGSDNYFQYSGSKFNFEGSSSSTVQLYKLDGGDTPEPPTPGEEKTYKKVSTITAGKNYVIAHSNNALQNNDGSAKAFSISGKVSNNTLTLTASEASSLEWKASASSSTKGEFKFANGGTYAYRETSTNVIKLSASAEEDRSAWTLSGTQLYNINSGGDKYYLNLSGTQWQATTGGSSAVITVYEENDGGDTPEPPTPTTKYYELVTSEPTAWDGTYLIVNVASGSAYAFDYSTAGTNNYASGTAVTISDGKIYSNATIDACAVTVSKYGDSHGSESEHAAYDIKVANGKYLYIYSNKIIQDSSEQGSGSSKRQNQHTLVYDNGVRMMFSGNQSGKTNNKYYFHFENDEFTYEGTKNASSDSKYRVFFFKLVDGDQPEKKTQTLSFANSAVEWTLGDTYKVGNSYDAQSVSGAKTTVTFTSSKASVATISDGKIKIAGTGETTITATAAEDATYKSATATYKLTIKPAATPSSEKTYKKVSTITAGKNYVIAHSNNALQNDGGTVKSFSISGKVSNNILTLTASEASSVEWKASASSSTKGDFKFANGGTYAYRETNTNVIKLSASAEEDRSAWTLSGTQLYNINSGGDKYYLNLSGTQWQATTGGSSAAITVYEENDGGDTPEPPTPGEEKTYKKVTSISEGTYIICGSENAGTYVCLFPPVTPSKANTSFTTSNKCEHTLFSSSNSITEIKTSDTSIIGSEVEITKSGSNWLVKYKANGTYMYYYNNEIAFTSSTSSAAQTISLTNGKGSLKTGTYVFYHSGTDAGFGYKSNKDANNLMFFKLDEGSTPDTPTPSGSAFNLENDYLKAFLDATEEHYTDNTPHSIVSQYTGSSSGEYVANDLPKPVSLSWTGSATSISIFEGTSTTGTAVKTMNFNSSSSVDIYNLIPGKTYSYKTSNNQTGTFSTTGRRRMIKVSDEVSQNHARNCRDLGGVMTRKGETLNYGLMYRGTNMDDVGNPGYEAEKNILLNELGIILDQDLRGSSKSPIGVTISGEKYDANTIQNQDGNNMTTTVSDVLNSVINGNPVYIHCQIGSDRTGHMCMLYLALLGCDLKECDIDYEITSFASKMTYGNRTIGSGNEASFRSKFIGKAINGKTFDADHVPEAVERYVTNVLGIDIEIVNDFRKAMGVSESL